MPLAKDINTTRINELVEGNVFENRGKKWGKNKVNEGARPRHTLALNVKPSENERNSAQFKSRNASPRFPSTLAHRREISGCQMAWVGSGWEDRGGRRRRRQQGWPVMSPLLPSSARTIPTSEFHQLSSTAILYDESKIRRLICMLLDVFRSVIIAMASTLIRNHI